MVNITGEGAGGTAAGIGAKVGIVAAGGNPFIAAGIGLGVSAIFSKVFGGGDRNVTLSGVHTGSDTSWMPSIIQQQLGLVPKQTFTKSKYRHLGAIMNRNFQEVDRLANRTVNRAATIAKLYPEFSSVRDELTRSRNANVLATPSSPGHANVMLQNAFDDTVRGEMLISEFMAQKGDSNKFFAELNRRTEFDIARSQIPLLQAVAADPNNPKRGQAIQDMENLNKKLAATGTPIVELSQFVGGVQPSSTYTLGGTIQKALGKGGGTRLGGFGQERTILTTPRGLK